LRAIGIAVLICYKGNRIQTTANYNRHAINDDLLRCSSYSHHAGGTLAVYAHAGYRARQSCNNTSRAAYVVARRALLHGTTDYYVIDFARIDTSAFNGCSNCVSS
jgi:hypothetical protein